jgi:zinc protease
VEQAFGNWKGAPNSGSASCSASNQADSEIGAPKRVTETRDKKQAVVVIGFPGTTFFSPDRYALELLQEACSDLGSRLFLRVREKLGLAYYVGAQHMAGLAPGYFAFYCGTEPGKAAQVEAELLREAGLLRAEGLSEEELKRAKAKVIGQRKIARQELGSLATNTALDELYGLGYAHFEAEDRKIEAVTLAEVRAAAEKHLQAQTAVISVISPES